MLLAKCDNCKKESKIGSNEFAGEFFDCKLFTTEPKEIFDKRLKYAKEVLKGDLGELTYKRKKEFDFCSLKCLREFVNTKLSTVYDDWKEYIDSCK